MRRVLFALFIASATACHADDAPPAAEVSQGSACETLVERSIDRQLGTSTSPTMSLRDRVVIEGHRRILQQQVAPGAIADCEARGPEWAQCALAAETTEEMEACQ